MKRLRSYLICSFLLVFSLLGILQTTNLRQAGAAVVDLSVLPADVGGANPSFNPASPALGSTVQVTTKVKNMGGANSSGAVTIHLILPAGFTNPTSPVTNGNFTCTGTTGTINCVTGGGYVLNAGSTDSFTIGIVAGAAGTQTVNATDSGGGDTVNANDSTGNTNNIFVQEIDLAVDAAHVGAANPSYNPATGTQFTNETITTTIMNVGNTQSTGVVTLQVTLPPGYSNSTTTTTTGNGAPITCSGTTGTVTCTTGAGYHLVNGTPDTVALNVFLGSGSAGTQPVAAKVSGGSDTDSDADNDNVTQSNLTVTGKPDLAITGPTISGTHNGGAPTEGYETNVTLTVTNNGQGTASSQITVTGTLPNHWYLGAGAQSATPSGVFGNAPPLCTGAPASPIQTGQTVTCKTQVPAGGTFTSLSPTQSITVTFPIYFDLHSANASSTCFETATFGVSSTDDPIVDPADDQVSWCPGVVGSPFLTVTKIIPGGVSTFYSGPSSTGQIEFSVSNNGDGPTTGPLTVTDVLPVPLTYDGAVPLGGSGGWTCSGTTTLTCNLPSLGSFGTSQVFVTLNIPGCYGGGATNTATVTGGGDPFPAPGPVPARNQSQITMPACQAQPDLSIIPTGSNGTPIQLRKGGVPVPGNNTLIQGDTTQSLYVTFENLGAGAANGVSTLTGTLPAGLVYNGGTFTSGSFVCNGGGTSVSCTDNPPSPIAPGAQIHINIPILVNSATTPNPNTGANPITFSVTTSGEPSGDGNDSYNLTGVTILTPQLTVTKSIAISGGNPSPCNGVNFCVDSTGAGALTQGYSFDVANIGSAQATAPLNLTDTLPTGISFKSKDASSTQWDCSGTSVGSQSVTCFDSTNLPNGQHAQALIIDVTVARQAAPSAVNGTYAIQMGSGTPVAGSPSVTTTVLAPDLTVSKSHPVSPSFQAGSSGTWTLTVTNVGNGPAWGATVSVVDTLPALPSSGTWTLNAAPDTGSTAGWNCGPITSGTINCSFTNTIANGGNAVLKITATPNQGTAPGCPANNVTDSSQDDVTPTSNDSASDPTCILAAPAPDLEIVKTIGTAFSVGTAGTYVLTIRNIGTAPAVPPTSTGNLHVVTDNLPTGGANPISWTLNSVTVSGGTGAGDGFSTGTCTTAPASGVTSLSCTSSTTIGVVGTGGETPIVITFNLIPTTTGQAPNTNTATLSEAQGETLPDTNNSSSISTPIGAGADLGITKTHNGDFSIGGAGGNFVMTVTNVGSVAIPSGKTVTVQDNLPPGLQGPGAPTTPGVWSCAAATGSVNTGQSVICSVTTASILGPGTSLGPLTIPVTVVSPAAAGQTLTNTAFITGCPQAQVNVNCANDTATDQVQITATPTADLRVTKTANGTFTTGVNSTFTITVTNNGAVASSGTITLTDTLPGGLTYVSAVGPGWSSCSTAPSTTPSCQFTGSLAASPAANSSTTLTLTVMPTQCTAMTNSVTVTGGLGGGTDPTPTDNTATAQVTPGCAPDLAVTKTSSPGNFVNNGTGSYIVTVSNVGPASTPNGNTVTLVDTLDTTSVTYNGFTSATFNCSFAPATPLPSEGQLTCTRIAPFGASGTASSTDTVTINVTADCGSGGCSAPFPKSVTNVATISSSPTADPNTANDRFTYINQITSGPQADIGITESPNPDNMAIGGTGTINLNVTNVGTATYGPAPITVIDTLPSALTFNGGVSVGWTCTPNTPAPGQVQCVTTGGVTLPAGGSQAFSFNVNVSAAASPGPVTNTANITPSDDVSGNDTVNHTITLAVQTVSAANSCVAVTPSTGLIAGSSTAMVTVTVRDSSGVSGAPMANQTVTLNTTSGGSNLNPAMPRTATTDNTGLATFNSQGANVGGTYTFTATVNGVTITNPCTGSTASATWTTPPSNCPTVANSSITASATTLAINASVTLTVQTTNGFGVGVPATVTITTSTAPSGVTLIVSPTTTTTNAFGQATITATANGNATIIFTATVQCAGGGTITLSQTPTVTWGTGSSSGGSTTNTFTISTNYTCLPADNITTATITTNIKVTSTGNGVSGKTVTLTGNPTLGTISPSSGTTDTSGNVIFTVRSATQGTEPFTAVDTTDNVTFPTLQITFNAPGTKVCVSPNATLTPISGQPSEAIVITRLLCDRDGPGFGYARYAPQYWMHFHDIVTVFGKTTRVPGLQARDLCIHKGGPTWYLVRTPLGFVVWANANFIRVGLVNFRNLPVLVPPAAPGAQGAPQAAIVGPISGPPPTH